MIVRIVKMEFVPEHSEAFLNLFESVKDKIRMQEGCYHLELLREQPGGNIFFTYSHWEDEAALNKYRHSNLFEVTWKKTKALFSQRAQAWSATQEHVLC